MSMAGITLRRYGDTFCLKNWQVKRVGFHWISVPALVLDGDVLPTRAVFELKVNQDRHRDGCMDVWMTDGRMNGLMMWYLQENTR